MSNLPDETADLRPELQVLFTRLNATGQAKASMVAQSLSAALTVVELTCQAPSRARSIVVTKLQEAAFFGVMALAEEEANRE